jgi:HPt (histidine-containing phosphotransfer) domain-containing protein
MLEDLAQRLGAERSAVEPVAAQTPHTSVDTPATYVGEPIVSRLVHHPRLRRVVIAFGEQLQTKLRAMDEALVRNDLRAIAELAHWLKGSGGTVGYDAFFEPARQLEESARSGAASAIADRIAELHTMAARLLVPDEPANTASTTPALRSA